MFSPCVYYKSLLFNTSTNQVCWLGIVPRPIIGSVSSLNRFGWRNSTETPQESRRAYIPSWPALKSVQVFWAYNSRGNFKPGHPIPRNYTNFSRLPPYVCVCLRMRTPMSEKYWVHRASDYAPQQLARARAQQFAARAIQPGRKSLLLSDSDRRD